MDKFHERKLIWTITIFVENPKKKNASKATEFKISFGTTTRSYSNKKVIAQLFS